MRGEEKKKKEKRNKRVYLKPDFGGVLTAHAGMKLNEMKWKHRA